MDELARLILESDKLEALNELDRKISTSGVYEIREWIYPAAQMILNPPFINPHLPKMYNILRELYPHLGVEDQKALLRLEVSEYAQRTKLPPIPRSQVEKYSDATLEEAIEEKDGVKAAAALSALQHAGGNAALSERLISAGGGYLDDSLGHSVSCTSFILREITEHTATDSWPSISVLADYFCKGGYATYPEEKNMSSSSADIDSNILRAVSGTGVGSLHDTITIYSIDSARSLVGENVANNLISSWVEYLGEKEEAPYKADAGGREAPSYPRFHEFFSDGRIDKIVAGSLALLGGKAGVKTLGAYLLKSLCEGYKGKYDPHYFTGLGSLLWVLDRYSDRREIQATALYQYLDFIL